MADSPLSEETSTPEPLQKKRADYFELKIPRPLGEKDLAFEWLEREFAARSGIIFMLKAHPYWDPIRSDPRYGDLVRRAGLSAD